MKQERKASFGCLDCGSNDVWITFDTHAFCKRCLDARRDARDDMGGESGRYTDQLRADGGYDLGD